VTECIVDVADVSAFESKKESSSSLVSPVVLDAAVTADVSAFALQNFHYSALLVHEYSICRDLKIIGIYNLDLSIGSVVSCNMNVIFNLGLKLGGSSSVHGNIVSDANLLLLSVQ